MKLRSLCKQLAQGTLHETTFRPLLYDAIRSDPAQKDELIAAWRRGEVDELREGIAWMLRDFPAPDTVEPLCLALTDDRPTVRWAVCQALGRAKDVRAVEPLCSALNDTDSGVRCWAAQALGRIGDSRAFEPLLQALADNESSVHLWAAEALGILKNPMAFEPLCQVLADDALNTARERAAWALGEIADSRAVEPLALALSDENASVQRTAAEALGKFGTAAVDHLCRSLEQGSQSARYQAIVALGQIGDSAAISSLCCALADHESDDLLRIADAEIQWAAVDALASFGEAAIEPLCQTLAHADAGTRRRAGWSLVKVGPAVVEPLCSLVVDPSQSEAARQEAARALGHLQDDCAIDVLMPLVESESGPIGDAAARALIELGSIPFAESDEKVLPTDNAAASDAAFDCRILADGHWKATPWEYSSLRYLTFEADGSGKFVYGYGQTIYADIRCRWEVVRPGRLRLTYLESAAEDHVPGFRPRDNDRVKEVGYRLVEGPVVGRRWHQPFEYRWTFELSDHPWPARLSFPYGMPRVFYGGQQVESSTK